MTPVSHSSSSSEEGLSSTAANVVMSLVAFVAVLSLLFETAQNVIMRMMSKKHNPELFVKLAEGFFRELTILGFVGVVLHITERSNVLEPLAAALDLEHSELLHYFHLVHLVVFLVMMTYVLIVSLLTRRLSGLIVKWNTAEYANTTQVCIAVERSNEVHHRAKKALIELYQYKLLRYSFLFPYAGGIDPKKRGADPRTFPFHKYLRNCLVEDTIRIVKPSKAVTIGLLALAMAARPLYTLESTYLMLAAVVLILLLDLSLVLLTHHVKDIYVTLLAAKLPLSLVEQFEDTDEVTSPRGGGRKANNAFARSYTRQLEDRAEDRLRKLHDTIGAVWTASKKLRKNASRILRASTHDDEHVIELEAEMPVDEKEAKEIADVCESEESVVADLPGSIRPDLEKRDDSASHKEGDDDTELDPPQKSVRIEMETTLSKAASSSTSVASSGTDR